MGWCSVGRRHRKDSSMGLIVFWSCVVILAILFNHLVFTPDDDIDNAEHLRPTLC